MLTVSRVFGCKTFSSEVFLASLLTLFFSYIYFSFFSSVSATIFTIFPPFFFFYILLDSCAHKNSLVVDVLVMRHVYKEQREWGERSK